MMNPPPYFIEHRILHIISCDVFVGTQHSGLRSNSTLPLPALSLFRGVQETGWPALICPTMCNDHFKAMKILTHNFARAYKACNKQGGPLLLYVQPEHFHLQNSDNSPMRLNMYATRETQLSRRWKSSWTGIVPRKGSYITQNESFLVQVGNIKW